jgi:hypothetical protein
MIIKSITFSQSRLAHLYLVEHLKSFIFKSLNLTAFLDSLELTIVHFFVKLLLAAVHTHKLV